MFAIFFLMIMLCHKSNCPPLMRRCGCLILTDASSGSLKADCSNSSGLNLDCLAELQVEYLDLSGNELAEVPAALNLSGFETLKHLDLSWNKITRLDSYHFGNGTLLKSLNISHNYLTGLPTEKAVGLSIDVSDNKLTDMNSLFGLAYTNVIARGNPIICNCRSPAVKKMIKIQSNAGFLKVIECSLDDKDLPKPITVQCHDDIDKEMSPLSMGTGIFILVCIIVGTIFVIVAFRYLP